MYNATAIRTMAAQPIDGTFHLSGRTAVSEKSHHQRRIRVTLGRFMPNAEALDSLCDCIERVVVVFRYAEINDFVLSIDYDEGSARVKLCSTIAISDLVRRATKAYAAHRQASEGSDNADGYSLAGLGQELEALERVSGRELVLTPKSIEFTLSY